MEAAILHALFEWALRAAVLAAALGASLWVLRIRDLQIRLTAWTLVLVGAMSLPLFTAVLPPIDLRISVDSSAADTLPRTMPSGISLPETPVVSDGPASPPHMTMRVLLAIWLAGVTVLLGRLLAGLWLTRRLVAASRPVFTGVRESEAVDVPVTVGLHRPLVLLPADWSAWSENRLQAVLAHESAHVQRRDPLRQFCASLYAAVCWFHPLAWWIRSHLIQLAEQASDDAAIGSTRDRIGYAETLLSFFKRSRGRTRLEGVAMADRRFRTRRVERVLDERQELSKPITARVTIAILSCAAPVIYIAAAIKPAPVEGQTATVCGGSAPFAKWANEDVLYIMTDQERNSFNSLTTTAACSDFVERFWASRDPSPGTPENEAKDEHYRRIAYANERFPSGIAGWRTDRGRIYIKFGPPPEIEAHPQGGGAASTYPNQQWRYKHIDGIGDDVRFEFVDDEKTGEYKLTRIVDAQNRPVLTKRGSTSRTESIIGVRLGTAEVATLSTGSLRVAYRDRGAIIVSLEPWLLPSVTAVGVANTRGIAFQAGGHRWMLEFSTQALGAGAWTAYAYYDPTYQPREDIELTPMASPRK